MEEPAKIRDSGVNLLIGAADDMVFSSGDTDRLYRIGDLAREFSLSLRALRFYEDRGLLNPRRAGSVRLYTGHDYARLQLVMFGRRAGFTLAEVKQLIDLWESGGRDRREVKAILDKSKKKLAALEKKQLELDQSIIDLHIFIAHLSEITI